MKLLTKSIYGVAFALMLSTSSFADCTYELFTISSTKNTKIMDFIEQLSDECSFSIIVTDPNAEKLLNSKLNKTNIKNLTIDEVLNLILVENNLSYTLQNNLLKISYLTTKVFSIDYILSQRKSEGSTDVTLSSSSASSGGLSGASGSTGSSTGATSASGQGGSGQGGSNAGIKIESSDEVKFWDNLDQEFRQVLNRPSDTYKATAPIINKNAGLVTITATDKQLKRFESYLKKLQDKVQLQVLIDVQLLSVTMNKSKTTGVDWSQLYALQNVNINLPTATLAAVTKNKNSLGNLATITSKTGGISLTEVIKFLKTQGDVHSISNPKVLTLNNQPALITAGTEYFYKLTSTQTLAGGTGSGAQSANENIQSVFSGVLLNITPEISDNNTITLKINPSLSETTTDISGTSNANRTMPPDLNRRQLSSVVTVKDGNRIILGGLINTKITNNSNKIPILGDIPILSYFFKYEAKIKQVQELVIIIEPHIIHKSNNTISLSELGYKGLSDDILTSKSVSSSDKNTTKK